MSWPSCATNLEKGTDMPKATKRKKSKSLFRMDDHGKTADGKGSLYCGYVGESEIGYVTARTQSAARKKLLSIARSKLK